MGVRGDSLASKPSAVHNFPAELRNEVFFSRIRATIKATVQLYAEICIVMRCV
jgi:hypothetical protein